MKLLGTLALAPFAAASECSELVSTDTGMTNMDCQELCDKGDKSYQDHCTRAVVQYTDEGSVIAVGGCFENWVFGYSEPDDLKGYKIIEDVEHPAQCQAKCQLDSDCISWLWSSDLIQWDEYDTARKCAFKSSAQLVNAVEEILDPGSGPSDFGMGNNPDFCNVNLSYSCFYGGYNCLKCNGDTRCVWESVKHLSGPIHCGITWDPCDPTIPPSTTTTTTKPTTTTTTPSTTTTTTTTTKPTTTTTTPSTTTTTTTTTPTTTTTTPTTTTTTTTTTKPTTTTTTPTTTTTTTKPTTTTTTKPTTTTTTTKPTTTTTTTTKPTTTTTTTKPTTTTITTTKPTTTTTKPTTTTTTTTKPTTTTTTTTKPTTTTTTPTTTTTTTTKPTTTTTTTHATSPTPTTHSNTTEEEKKSNKGTIVIGSASAVAGLAALAAATRYFSKQAPTLDADFDTQVQADSDDVDRETHGAVTEEMYA